MNVLFITGHGVGGSNVSLLNTLTGLIQNGCNVQVIVPDEMTSNLFKKNSISCTIVPFRPSIWPVCTSWHHYLSFPLRLLYQRVINYLAQNKITQLARHFNPDIIHTNISVVDLGYQVANKMNIPHIFHFREYGDRDFKYKRYPSQKQFYKKIENSYSIAITKDLKNYYSLSDERSVVIYNGIMPQRNYAPMKKENYFLYVGGLSHEKGIDLLVGTFISLIKEGEDLQLYVCGSGNKGFVDNVQTLVNSEGNDVSSRIAFLGQRSDVYELMTKAKALVVPSLSEAFGRITAEAMFNDCLVVGNNTAGTKEQFDNGLSLTGEEIGIRYSNDHELKSAIKTVNQKNEDLFNPMREKAFYVVNSLYSAEHNVEEILRFYHRIMD